MRASTSDNEEHCCGLVQKRRAEQEPQQLLRELERRIKARHAQLGGYEHDEREHLLEAKRLAREGRHEAAKLEVRLALESRAVHAREKAKYANLVSLRNMLQEAKRNLTMAELLQRCNADMQRTLARMPDVMALRDRLQQQRERVTDDQAVLLEPLVEPSTASAVEDEVVVIAEQDVLDELERLVTPTHVPSPNTAPQAERSKPKALYQ